LFSAAIRTKAEDASNDVINARGPSLLVENLALMRGGRRLAQGLSFTLESGQALSITGPNGAGKSTLLRVLAGLLPPAAGTITLSGIDPQELAQQIHYAGHAEALKNALTARENLQFWSDLLAGPNGLTPQQALERVNLAHLPDLPVSYLSAGQRRRVALARLLVAPRPLWLMDEPATALDSASQARLAELMEGHLRGGGLIVAATHSPLGIPAQELPLGARP
jgi:heme exporter protein A